MWQRACICSIGRSPPCTVCCAAACRQSGVSCSSRAGRPSCAGRPSVSSPPSMASSRVPTTRVPAAPPPSSPPPAICSTLAVHPPPTRCWFWTRAGSPRPTWALWRTGARCCAPAPSRSPRCGRSGRSVAIRHTCVRPCSACCSPLVCWWPCPAATSASARTVFRSPAWCRACCPWCFRHKHSTLSTFIWAARILSATIPSPSQSHTPPVLLAPLSPPTPFT
mmetsp:Transcript_5978/g.18293  ORF Transcript_5978/g.18293 Transcript_5978/m.18293 type:complete len:222 (+) Transcript_5978:477-1142(+)